MRGGLVSISKYPTSSVRVFNIYDRISRHYKWFIESSFKSFFYRKLPKGHAGMTSVQNRESYEKIGAQNSLSNPYFRHIL